MEVTQSLAKTEYARWMQKRIYTRSLAVINDEHASRPKEISFFMRAMEDSRQIMYSSTLKPYLMKLEYPREPAP